MSLHGMRCPRISWLLLAGATALWMLLSADRATAQLSRCPDIATLPLLVLAMLVASTSLHAWVLWLQSELIHSERFSTWFSSSSARRILGIAAGALITAATLLLDIILWAWLYRRVGAIPGLEASLYFSGITFTTVGYGDITLARCWRLLSVGEAVNGVLMAGWSAAQLIFLVQRLMTLRLRSQGRSED